MLAPILIIFVALVGYAMGYLSAMWRYKDTKVGTPSASHNSARLAISLLSRLDRYMYLHGKHEWEYVYMLLNEWRKETAAE